jgi:streptogramin lyase
MHENDRFLILQRAVQRWKLVSLALFILLLCAAAISGTFAIMLVFTENEQQRQMDEIMAMHDQQRAMLEEQQRDRDEQKEEMRKVLLRMQKARAAVDELNGEAAADGAIETIAGTGVPGFTGDGGLATKAKLNQPFHCDLGANGSLYIADAGSHCIRKVDLKSGNIKTVAGTGKKGYTGDGSAATDATFDEPYAVAVTDAGDLYAADRLNAVIRKVDGKTGIVSTVAGTGKKGFGGDGGPGKDALLIEPNDVFLDGKGGLLIADVGDWRIRRLDLKTGTITTFAGIGRPAKAGKGFPRDQIGDGGRATKAVIVGARAVCVDAEGNTYICEREGSTIRKVDRDGIIATIAGTGKWGYSGDGGPARKAVFKGPKAIRPDPAGSLYVVDTENHAVRKIDGKTGIVTTIAGGQKGPDGLDRPHGCVVDAQGNLYIADSENHRVRKVSR